MSVRQRQQHELSPPAITAADVQGPATDKYPATAVIQSGINSPLHSGCYDNDQVITATLKTYNVCLVDGQDNVIM